MDFWVNTWSNALGGIAAGLFLVLMYLLIQWFLRATDLVVSYNWGYRNDADGFHVWPNLDIRNRSSSRSYRLANIAYTRKGKPHWFDNKSIWGTVVEPGSMNHDFTITPVKRVDSLPDALTLEVTIRLQTGRAFWLRGHGPGRMGKGRLRRLAFWLRDRLEKMLIAME